MVGDKALVKVDNREIQSMIYTLRGRQVMIDRDLAYLYNVETKVLNQAVKRNISRFPESFRFQISDDEKDELVTNCDRFKTLKHSSSNPYAFTEQGIAMLSAVLKSDVAVEVSVKIMDSFVEMRNFLLSNREMFARLDRIELKQLETDKKLEEVFDYISTTKEVKQKIFFDGQIYDAFSLMVELVEKAMGEKDVAKFNSQYPNLIVKIDNSFHDRFIIIDRKEVYHVGASIKDAGKKSFGITKLDVEDLTKSLLDKVL